MRNHAACILMMTYHDDCVFVIDTFCAETTEFQDGCTYNYLHCACPVITRLEYRDLVRVCNLHVTYFEIRHALSMPKFYRKIEICCLFTLESQTELLCYGHIVITRITMRRNFEVRIFKLCHTIIVVERTGVQWVQKTYKVHQNRKGRQVCILQNEENLRWSCCKISSNHLI